MASTVTKKDLIDRVADETGQTRVVVKNTVQRFLEAVVQELAQGKRIEFRDFGVFDVKTRKGRTAQNPKTLERIQVPPKNIVKFKAGRYMQDSVDEGCPTPVVEVRPVKPSSQPVAAVR